MPDGEIRVGITAQYADADAKIRAFADSSAASLSRLKDAQAAYDRAAAGSATQSQALGAAFDRATASGLGLTEAMEAAVAATTQLGSAQGVLAGTTARVTTNFYAAQGAAGLLEGRVPIRAFERFISQSEALSGILQSAFPLIGAIALTEIVVRGTEKLYAFGQEAETLSRELGTDWLTAAAGQMTGLATAVKQADDEIEKLNRDIDTLNHKSITASVENIKLTQGTAAGYRAEADEKRKVVTANERALVLLQQQANLLKEEAKPEQVTDPKSGVQSTKDTLDSLAASKQLAVVQKQITDYQKTNNVLKQEAVNLDIEASKVKPPKQNFRDDEQDLAARRLAAEEAIKDEKEITEVIKKRQEAFGKMVVLMARDNVREQEESDRTSATIVENWEKQLKAMTEAAEESYLNADAQIEASARTQEASIRAAEAVGTITRLAADEALAAVHAKEYADKVAILNEQLRQLNIIGGEGGDVGKQISAVGDKLGKTTGSGQAQATQDQGKITNDLAAPYIKATDMINNAWLQMQNKLIFGTRNVSQAFANMGVSMLESVAASFEKMLVKQLQMEIKSIIAHQAGNTAKTTSDVTAAATGDALKEKSALKENFINAKTAATGAFKGVMSHVPPPLNFILAPVAAAGAFAGTLAVGAFETGGIVPNTGLALVHEGEGVMPRNLTNLLTTVANSHTSNSSNATVNTTTNYQGITDRNFREMARRHSASIADAVGREVRAGRRF